jgi:serine/threonine protein kinase
MLELMKLNPRQFPHNPRTSASPAQSPLPALKSLSPAALSPMSTLSPTLPPPPLLSRKEYARMLPVMCHLDKRVSHWLNEHEIKAQHIEPYFKTTPPIQQAALLGEVPCTILRDGPDFIVFKQYDATTLIGKGGGGFGVFKGQRYKRSACGKNFIPGEFVAVKMGGDFEEATSECKHLKIYPPLSSAQLFFAHEEYTFISMPIIQGLPLDKFLDAYSVTPEQALEIAINISCEIALIHNDLKILHGDIKPGNIMIDPKTLKVVIIDFGCARDAAQTPKNKKIGGTPIYLDPVESCLNLEHQIHDLKLQSITQQTSQLEQHLEWLSEQLKKYTEEEIQFASALFNKSNTRHLDREVDIYALGIVFLSLLHPIANEIFPRNPTKSPDEEKPVGSNQLAQLRIKPPKQQTNYFFELIKDMTTPDTFNRLKIEEVITKLQALQNRLYNPVYNEEQQVLTALSENLNPNGEKTCHNIIYLIDAFIKKIGHEKNASKKIDSLRKLKLHYIALHTEIEARLTQEPIVSPEEVLDFFKRARSMIHQKECHALFYPESRVLQFMHSVSRVVSYPLGAINGNTRWKEKGFLLDKTVADMATTISNRITQSYFHRKKPVIKRPQTPCIPDDKRLSKVSLLSHLSFKSPGPGPKIRAQ